MRFPVLAILPILILAGCGTQSTMPTTTTAGPSPTLGAQPASKAPESANSLPNGSQTDTSLTPTAGDLNTTRVGPATRAVRRSATTGY